MEKYKRYKVIREKGITIIGNVPETIGYGEVIALYPEAQVTMELASVGYIELVEREKEVEVVIERPKCGKCSKEKKPLNTAYVDSDGYCRCGRPSEYTEELLEKAREYIGLIMPNVTTEEVIHSVEGLSLYINVRRSTIYEWIKDSAKSEFSDIYDQLMAKQGKRLIGNGLNQTFSGTITKLMLTKHGYRDVVDNFNREIPVDPDAKKASDEAIDSYLKDK